MMTIEANRQLMARGYSIDTTELEELVEALKKLEQSRTRNFLRSDARAAGKRALREYDMFRRSYYGGSACTSI